MISIEFKYRQVGSAYKCCYCGTTADTIDHTVPRSHVRQHLRAHRSNWFPKVSACMECNVLLGSQVTETFAERKEIVARKLRARYRKQLAAAGWGKDELSELGYTLRTMVKKNSMIGDWVGARIMFAEIPTTQGVPNDLFGQRLEKPEEPAEPDTAKYQTV